MKKIKKFFAYIFVLLTLTDAADAVNVAASEDELDELVVKKAGFNV